MRGRPGRRERHHHQRTNRSRCHRSTVAGEPAPTRRATAATPVARSATPDGQTVESADSNASRRPIGGAGQASRAGGLDASTTRIGSQRGSERRAASRVAQPLTMPTSIVLPGCDIATDSLKSLISGPFCDSRQPSAAGASGAARGHPRAAARPPGRTPQFLPSRGRVTVGPLNALYGLRFMHQRLGMA